MKHKLMIAALAGALSFVGAGSALAGNSGTGAEYGTQPGYTKASDCGEFHGAFDYYGKDNNLAGGTDGTTGERNSAKGCQHNK